MDLNYFHLSCFVLVVAHFNYIYTLNKSKWLDNALHLTFLHTLGKSNRHFHDSNAEKNNFQFQSNYKFPKIGIQENRMRREKGAASIYVIHLEELSGERVCAEKTADSSFVIVSLPQGHPVPYWPRTEQLIHPPFLVWEKVICFQELGFWGNMPGQMPNYANRN